MKIEHFDQHIKTSIAIGSFLAFMGVWLGVAYLMKKAPERLSPSVFAEAGRNVESLVEGGPMPVFVLPVMDRGGDSFRGKRDLFFKGEVTQVEFSEAEINAWLAANFTPAKDPNIGDRPIALLPSVPKVSLQEGYMQVAMNLDLVLAGEEMSGIFTAQGALVKGSGSWKMNAENAAIASARIPGGGIAASTLVDIFKAVFSAAPEYQSLAEVLNGVASIEITPGLIRFSN